MKLGLALSIVFVLCGFCYAGEQDVLDFTDSTFETELATYETILVMFYAPWCGHCKRLKPEFAKAAEELKVNDPPVILAKVDCTEGGKETCNRFSVSGYPTLKIFRNGELSQSYNGPREADGIVKHMKSQVGPSSKELKNVKEFDTFVDHKDVSVVGFFKGDSDLKTAFLKAADSLRESVRFAHASESELLKKYDLDDGIILFRPPQLQNKFEDDRVVYKAGAEVDAFKDFITKNYHGLVGVRRNDNQQDFKNPLVIAYFNIDYVKNVKGTNYWRNRILKVAKQFAQDFTFAISNKDTFQHELNEFGIDYVKGDKPVVFARDEKNQKFAMKDEFSIENLEKFLNDLKDGKLEPFLKSEETPETNDAPVKVAVAKNFEDIVTNNGKDTLIEFYAPWCGHCKKLVPIYDELAQKLDNEDVAIVKMDATANDVPPEFEVQGFPTLYWVKKDDKKNPVRYEGGREVDDFVKYIAKHATTELKGFDRGGQPKKTEL